MGLAASQARFLGITLRKANCEFKSTELAQQRLELTNQMTDIAQEYANSLNATKLVWHNDMVCDSFGNPADYGLSYSLLMMPSAANDYNPYMVSTRSGAIVLNSKYADAAKAAGISEGGGTPSAEGRHKFLEALATSTIDKNGTDLHDNIITKYTYDILEQTQNKTVDEEGNIVNAGAIAPLSRNTLDVSWHSGAGMGAAPLNKSDSGLTHLNDLVKNSNIGGKNIDWLQIERALLGFTYNNATTTAQSDLNKNSYKRNVVTAKSNLLADQTVGMTPEQVSQYAQAAETVADIALSSKNGDSNYDTESKAFLTELKRRATDGLSSKEAAALGLQAPNPNDYSQKTNDPEYQKANAKYKAMCPDPETYKTTEYPSGKNNPSYVAAVQEYNDYVAYTRETYKTIANFAYLELNKKLASKTTQNDGERQQKELDIENAKKGAKNQLCWAIYQKYNSSSNVSGDVIGWEDGKVNANHKVELKDLFNTTDAKIIHEDRSFSDNAGAAMETFNKLTLAVNDVICTDPSEIKSLTIGDLLTSNVVLTARGAQSVSSVGLSAKAIMDYIGEVFGVNSPGTGLNVDDESAKALEKALSTVKKLFLNNGSAVAKGEDTQTNHFFMATITTTNDSALNCNQAYVNANNFNRIGTNNDKDYAAVNISNMVSAFLTYYDNYLRGSESAYIVGKGNTDGKTVFVTDDPNYVYVASNTEALTNDEKIADFFNQLYNNICDKGWRYDDMVQDSEHLESAVKDGRYQIMALNSDGYFYQMRYNDIRYMEEVQDEDAISRAESSYQVKKAQITFKEDQIDVKTKKLDAEITELNTEINSVQNIISKNIEKTFTMFSN